MATQSPSDEVAIKSYAKGSTAMVGVHFSANEFQCKCEKCDMTLISMELVGLLERIRSEVRARYGGKVVKINSGYRCVAHNKAIGGVKESMHTKGLAADIVVPGVSPELLAVVCAMVNPEGGVGSYPTFVHVDARGTRARW